MKSKKHYFISFIFIISIIFIFLTACDSSGSQDVVDDINDIKEDEYILKINHKGMGSTNLDAGEHIKDIDSIIEVSAEPDDGWKFLGWTGDIISDEKESSILMDESKDLTAHFIEENENGLVFEHRLILQEDSSNRPKMQVVIKNIEKNMLNLHVIGTIYGNLADKADATDKLFEFIDYDTFKVTTLGGEELNFDKNNKQVDPYNHQWDDFFNIDEINIETESYETIKIEYETVSNFELWEGFGGDLRGFEGHSNPAHFWSIFKEWLILRPESQKDGTIVRNNFYIDLPEEWEYAATYPENDSGGLDLGELEYMRWTNDLEWKNYQRAPLVLFHNDSYNLNKETVSGTKIKDVYHKSFEGSRNQEVNHQIFRFMSEFFGELPMEKVLYFSTLAVEGGGDNLEHGAAYASAPYSYGYSSKGRFIGGGGDLYTDEPQKWSIEHEPDEKYNHLFPIHGTIRLWVGSFIRGHNFSGLAAYAGSQAVASYYTDWDVNKHRYQRKYDFYLEEVVQEDGEEKDIHGVTGHNFYGYFKISLAYFYLDELISEKSNGERSLKGVINYVYSEVKSGYDISNVEKIKALLIDAIDFVAGDLLEDEYIEFMVKHYFFGDVNGHEFLDLSDYLE